MAHHDRHDRRISVPAGDGSEDAETGAGTHTVVVPTARRDDREEAEAAELRALRQQNERLERLFRTFRHDIRGQLMVASGRVELARQEGDTSGTHLDAVERAHDRIETLVDDVATLVANGHTVGERERIVVERLVEECWAAVETAEATLAVDVDRQIRADASRLSQVFENLFRNSVEHGLGAQSDTASTDDGEAALTVTVGVLPDASGFFVEDDGAGIPTDSPEQLFEAGFSTGDDGTGLGLAIVRDVVDAHGWEVTVTDGSDGGARFEITGVELRPSDA
jgi:signal transduction histidine kinase